AHTFFPAYVETVNDDSYMFTMLSSELIVAASVFCLIYILLARYEKQRIRIIEMGKELEEAANHDTLTGLYNRRYLMSTLGNWIKETDRKFLVTIIDIDDFKEINDKYGHLYGDEVLSEFAKIAKNEMKGNGIVARFGGEEFMFCFDGTDYVKAMEILDNIKKQLGEYSQNSRQIVITFSGGMVEYKAPEQIDNLFNDADDKLYQAKNSGKNRIVF
ncbi:MAG: GGDEF domain-containing protein, partial [Butyrivibrio sp.]